MSGHFSDNPGKRVVRESWNTPILRYFHNKHGVRYRYLGLPGEEIVDIRLWRDMIDEVIAFEVRAGSTRNDKDGRRWIANLRRNLQLLDLPSRTYLGYLEEVVILGSDYEGTRYSQSNVVTLYNLDFCNEIGSKIDTLEQGRQLWRFEAIRQILRDQAECYRNRGTPRGFVLLLTVRDQIRCASIREFLSGVLLSDTDKYVRYCHEEKPIPKEGYVLGTHSWALKAFLHDTLRKYMSNPHLSALFFPVVKYYGRPTTKPGGGRLDSPMLHFMVLCWFADREAPAPTYLPVEFLSHVASVRVSSEFALEWAPEPGEDQFTSFEPDPSRWLETIAPGLNIPWC